MNQALLERFHNDCDGVVTPFQKADALSKSAAMAAAEGMSSVDEILAVAKHVYDTFIKPIDIPGIPNFVESFVDDQLWVVVEFVVRTALEKKDTSE